MNLSLLPETYSILKLPSTARVPAWVEMSRGFLSITRTDDELSIVCNESLLYSNADANEIEKLSFVPERSRRALKVDGPLDFALTGILSQLLVPLAEAKISVFTVSTYDTDYVLIHDEKLADAVTILTDKGHRVEGGESYLKAPQSPWRPPTLETDRLILRGVELSDAESIFEYARNPNVALYTLWEPHASVESSRQFIRDYAHPKYAQQMTEPFGIELKSNPGKLIGTVGAFWTSQAARSMEVAYAISEEHWGKGITAEAGATVMQHCAREYKLKRIQARCKSVNKQSSRVMQKLGMEYEGTLKSAVFHRNQFWDMDYYAKVYG